MMENRDLTQVAIRRLRNQYRDSANLQAMISMVTSQVQEIQDAAFELGDAYDLDTATGEPLNVLGRIVGITRPTVDAAVHGFFGWDDDATAETWGDLTDPSVGGLFLSVFGVEAGTVPMEDHDFIGMVWAKIYRNHGPIGILISIGPPSVWLLERHSYWLGVDHITETTDKLFPDQPDVHLTDSYPASVTVEIQRALSGSDEELFAAENSIPIGLGIGVTKTSL